MKTLLPILRIIFSIAILLMLASPSVSQNVLGSAGSTDDTPSNPLGKASSEKSNKGGRTSSSKKKVVNKSVGSKGKASNNKSNSNQASQEKEKMLLEQVDELITKGNEARDAKPPRYDEAEAAYNSAVELAPKNATEYAVRANLGLGNIYLDQKRLTEAQIKYNRAIELDPKNYDAHLYLSYTYSRIGNLDEAIKELQSAIEINKQDYRAYRTLGGAYVRKGNNGEAEAAFRRAVELAPDVSNKCRLNFSLGYTLSRQKRYREAAVVFQTAETLAVNEVDWKLEAHFNYSDNLFGSGQWKLAEKEFNTLSKQLDDAEKTSPDKIKTIKSIRARLNYKTGLLYYLWNDMTRAREEWSAALKSGFSCDLCGSGLLILDNSFDRAQSILSRYTAIHPDDENGWLLLFDVRLALKDEEGAQTALKQALSLSPDYAKSWRPFTERVVSSKNRVPPSLKATGSLIVETEPNALINVKPIKGGISYRGIASAAKGVMVFDSLPVGTYLVTSKMENGTASQEVVIAANRKAVIRLSQPQKQ